MLVFGHIEAFDLTIGGARGDHGDLAVERNEGFQNCGSGLEFLPDMIEIVAISKHSLALAIITKAASLEYGRQSDARDRGTQARRRGDIGIFRGADAESFYEILFRKAILGGFQDFPIRQHRATLAKD